MVEPEQAGILARQLEELAAAVQGSGNGNGSNRAAGVLHCKPRHRQLSHQQQGRHQQAHALAGGDEHGPRRCSGCGSDTTSAWRRHPDSGARLCQACREFMRRHNGRLPLSGVQCLQCGGASAGPSKGAYWREHPLTGQRWICTPCFFAHRSCRECGATSPGARPRSSWYRHPVTGAEWLCERCRKREYQRMQSERRRAAKATAATGNSSSGAGSRAQVWQAAIKKAPAAEPAAQQVVQPPGKEERQPGKRRKMDAPVTEGQQERGQQEGASQKRKQQSRQQQQQQGRKRQTQGHGGECRQNVSASASDGAAAPAAVNGPLTDSDAATSSALGTASEHAEAATAEGMCVDELSLQESCLLLLLAQGLEAGTAEPWGPGFQPAGGKAGGR